MVIEASGYIKQFWQSLKQLFRALENFIIFSLAFRGLWRIQNEARSLLQFKQLGKGLRHL